MLRWGPDDDDRGFIRVRADWQAPTHTVVAAQLPKAEGPFFLQVARFSGEQRARTLVGKLDVHVATIAGTWGVHLGPYKKADKAIAALAPLAARGYPDAIIPR